MRKFNVTVNGTTYEVAVEEIAGGTVAAAPAPAPVAAPAPATPAPAPAAAPAPSPAPAPATAGGTKVSAPLPGNILKVCVSQGQSVKKGDVLCVIEAMKMENEIFAPADGTVASVSATQGATVNSGDVLFTIN